MRQPIQVLIFPVGLINSDWKYLLLHRVPSRGGFWQGVTGGVQEGEDLSVAASRELIEETGFSSFNIQKIDHSYSFPVEDKWRHIYGYDKELKEIVVNVFVARVEMKEPTIDPNEHDQWKWCRYDEALDLLKWQQDKEALKRCHSVLMTQMRE